MADFKSPTSKDTNLASDWAINQITKLKSSFNSHTHVLADITDVTASAAELNLLDLSGLTAGWVLSADSATTASWKAPTGGSGDKNVDGGNASSVYLPSQNVDGGSA